MCFDSIHSRKHSPKRVHSTYTSIYDCLFGAIGYGPHLPGYQQCHNFALSSNDTCSILTKMSAKKVMPLWQEQQNLYHSNADCLMSSYFLMDKVLCGSEDSKLAKAMCDSLTFCHSSFQTRFLDHIPAAVTSEPYNLNRRIHTDATLTAVSPLPWITRPTFRIAKRYSCKLAYGLRREKAPANIDRGWQVLAEPSLTFPLCLSISNWLCGPGN